MKYGDSLIPADSSGFVVGGDNTEFRGLPIYLRYVIQEFFKNSLRANMAQHAAAGTTPKDHSWRDVIEVVTSADDHRYCIRISDKCGGIPGHHFNHIISYLFTTRVEDPVSVSLPPQMVSPLSGIGAGIPLAQLYVHHMGGRVSINVMPGHGVDIHISVKKDLCDVLTNCQACEGQSPVYDQNDAATYSINAKK